MVYYSENPQAFIPFEFFTFLTDMAIHRNTTLAHYKSHLCTHYFQDDMRGSYFWPRLLLPASNRYRSILHTFLFLSAGFGYCILLGSYAFSRHHELTRSRNINITNSSTLVKVCTLAKNYLHD